MASAEVELLPKVCIFYYYTVFYVELSISKITSTFSFCFISMKRTKIKTKPENKNGFIQICVLTKAAMTIYSIGEFVFFFFFKTHIHNIFFRIFDFVFIVVVVVLSFNAFFKSDSIFISINS